MRHRNRSRCQSGHGTVFWVTEDRCEVWSRSASWFVTGTVYLLPRPVVLSKRNISSDPLMGGGSIGGTGLT